MKPRARGLLVYAVAVTAVLAGCAPVTKTTRVAQPRAQTAPAAPAAPGKAPPPAAAVVDSGPTPEALAVLADIPDPLTDNGGSATPAATGANAGGDAVPVPSPTKPLGDVAGAAVPVVIMAPDSSMAARASVPDTCWRVQLATTSDATKARNLAAAAGSLLMQPAEVEREGKLLKVRLKSCETKDAAAALKRRAVDAGFAGAFVFPGKQK